MKHYYVSYGEFANIYGLVYTETEQQDARAVSEGYQRITRKEAERLCRNERERAQYDSAFSGYASSVVLPIWYPADGEDWREDPCMKQDGYLVVRA